MKRRNFLQSVLAVAAAPVVFVRGLKAEKKPKLFSGEIEYVPVGPAVGKAEDAPQIGNLYSLDSAVEVQRTGYFYYHWIDPIRVDPGRTVLRKLVTSPEDFSWESFSVQPVPPMDTAEAIESLHLLDLRMYIRSPSDRVYRRVGKFRALEFFPEFHLPIPWSIPPGSTFLFALHNRGCPQTVRVVLYGLHYV